MNPVTVALEAVGSGEPQASERLLPLVYDELRRMAAQRMAMEMPGQTLQPTALVHEAWMQLSGPGGAPWQNRAHFFGAAAEAMRRILIARARRRLALKRGGGAEHVEWDDTKIAAPAPDEALLALDEALERLGRIEPRHAELVRLRYFAGLPLEEAAGALGISLSTAKRWWTYARAWLYRELNAEDPGGSVS